MHISSLYLRNSRWESPRNSHKAESVPPSAFSLFIHNCQPLYRYTHTPAAYSDVATNTTAIPSTKGAHTPAVFPGCLS